MSTSVTLPNRLVSTQSADCRIRCRAMGGLFPGGWWPPLMLEPGWVTENRDHFEVFHVHFGFRF